MIDTVCGVSVWTWVVVLAATGQSIVFTSFRGTCNDKILYARLVLAYDVSAILVCQVLSGYLRN